MDLAQLFFQRYDPLVNFYLAGLWEEIPAELLVQRPHPRVNSIAWILWHMTRVEDAAVNRFIAGRPQVLDEGGWMERMNIPYRHNGSEMTFDEVDELSRRVNLEGLRQYGLAVQARTREVVSTLTTTDLDLVLDETRLRAVLVDEGLVLRNPDGFVQNYLGWNSGKWLFNHALTHPYQHLGEIETIATLLGVVFE